MYSANIDIHAFNSKPIILQLQFPEPGHYDINLHPLRTLNASVSKFTGAAFHRKRRIYVRL